MSESHYELDITLPLKKWEKCDLDYDKAACFCRKRSTELRNQAKTKHSDPIFKTRPLVPEADMYDLCIIMLNLAQKLHANFFAMDYAKNGVVFGFRFPSEDAAEKFHSDFVEWTKRAGLVNPDDDDDTNLVKTFSSK